MRDRHKHIVYVGLLLASAFFAGAVHSAEFRVEGSLGASFGQNEAKSTLRAGPIIFDLDFGNIGGYGITGGVAVWGDGPLRQLFDSSVLDHFSFGIEYKHFENSATTSISAIIPALIPPVSASVKMKSVLTSENLMVNAAWRYNRGDMHPFIGGGIGPAFTTANAQFSLTSSLKLPKSVPTGFNGGVSAVTTAEQVFAGFDYDITENLYTGLSVIYHLTDTINRNFTHTKARIDPRQLFTLAHVGWRF